MRYINTLKDGDRITEIYLCKKKASGVAKNGKTFESLTLVDKTGSIDAKIWDPDSAGIGSYEELDFIEVTGNIQTYMGYLQMSISRLRKANANEYDPAEFVPTSEKNIDDMYSELMGIIDSINAPYMKTLINHFIKDDNKLVMDFKRQSAAKSVHHGFAGGLLEHTLSVTKNCVFFAERYPFLNRDLLLTASILHDIGKLQELSDFPKNDYTDEGQMLGHIYMGAEMVSRAIDDIEGFPPTRKTELIHCILAHHGELEFGSPKKPAIAEPMALSFADNIDAKMETFYEALKNTDSKDLSWQGFNRYIDSNIRNTLVTD